MHVSALPGGALGGISHVPLISVISRAVSTGRGLSRLCHEMGRYGALECFRAILKLSIAVLWCLKQSSSLLDESWSWVPLPSSLSGEDSRAQKVEQLAH